MLPAKVYLEEIRLKHFRYTELLITLHVGRLLGSRSHVVARFSGEKRDSALFTARNLN